MTSSQSDPGSRTERGLGPGTTSRAHLFRFLEDLAIETTTTDHPAVHTVEESRALRGDLPGRHCKNLFLKDKKGRLWLVSTPDNRVLDLKRLRRLIGAAHLSFGRPDLLLDALGVTPGSVTPFATMNVSPAGLRW